MTNPFLRLFVLLFLLEFCSAHGESPVIRILGSWTEGDLGADAPRSIVLFGIHDVSEEGGLASDMSIKMESVCKAPNDSTVIHENAQKTIAGFTASNVRVNYKINLIWIGRGNETLIDQNLNLRLANMLKKLKVEMPFDPTGFFLDKIKDQSLYIGYDTDSTKGSSSFELMSLKTEKCRSIPRVSRSTRGMLINTSGRSDDLSRSYSGSSSDPRTFDI